MFRSIFDHPQGDIFFVFTSVTKEPHQYSTATTRLGRASTQSTSITGMLPQNR